MKVAFLSDGRDWSYRIAEGLAACSGKRWKLALIVTTSDGNFPKGPLEKLGTEIRTVDHKELVDIYNGGAFGDYDVLLFYGWSWIVPKELVEGKLCICLHPSPLPRYRGGSPIQHQIINGERESAVSLFRMTTGLDTGSIYKQRAYSLEGHLGDVIGRIGDVGLGLTLEMLDEMVEKRSKPLVQDESKATTYKRRAREESELTEGQLDRMSGSEFFNFVRALEDPYPNAYVRLVDGVAILKRVEPVRHADAVGVLPVNKLRSMTKEEFARVVKGGATILCSDGECVSIKEAVVKEQLPT
jgi:methionyl-tRNA formyltransferase